MIHEIGRELEAKLSAKGCPFKVLDRESTKPTAWRNAVVIEETGDSYTSPTSQSRNPKRYYDGKIGATLTIYAQQTRTGALEYEHRRLARVVVDLVLVALRTIRGERRQHIAIGAGKWVPIADLSGSERQGGVAYELAIVVDRAVADKTFAGAIAEEFTFGADSITSTTTVSEIADDPSPETACGGA